MTEEGIKILRMVLAGLNGLIFVVGVYLLQEYAFNRPKRIREYLAKLIAKPEENDSEQTEEELPASKDDITPEEEIERLKKKLYTYYQTPVNLLNIGFSMLMIVVSIFAMMSLLFPAFGLFK